jgi:hypothetical protein
VNGKGSFDAFFVVLSDQAEAYGGTYIGLRGWWNAAPSYPEIGIIFNPLVTTLMCAGFQGPHLRIAGQNTPIATIQIVVLQSEVFWPVVGKRQVRHPVVL